ncbi:MAG TPA: hypothetical protein VIL16_34580 [Trebonia sp.]
MTWPSLDSCTDPATMVTSIGACAQRRPAAQVLSAKVMTPVLFASLVTVSPAVASLARRETRARGALSAWSSRSRWACVAPFLLGEGQAVQYSLKPCSRARTRIPARPAENYLRDAMIKTLEAGPWTFDFMAQVQTDPWELARLRQAMNQVDHVEPTGEEQFPA